MALAFSMRSTQLLGVRHPIVLAPVGGFGRGRIGGGRLRAGGLGLLGDAYGDRGLAAAGAPIVAEGTDQPWGVGFLARAVEADAVEMMLEFNPAAGEWIFRLDSSSLVSNGVDAVRS